MRGGAGDDGGPSIVTVPASTSLNVSTFLCCTITRVIDQVFQKL